MAEVQISPTSALWSRPACVDGNLSSPLLLAQLSQHWPGGLFPSGVRLTTYLYRQRLEFPVRDFFQTHVPDAAALSAGYTWHGTTRSV